MRVCGFVSYVWMYGYSTRLRVPFAFRVTAVADFFCFVSFPLFFFSFFF